MTGNDIVRYFAIGFVLGSLAAALGIWSAHAQTGTLKDKPTLNTETTTNFPDNTTGQITPAITRQSIVDYIASWMQMLSVTNVGNNTYTYLNTDNGKLTNFTNSGATAVTLPQATNTFASWASYTCARGAGNVTITTNTSTINGAANLAVNTGKCVLIVSDGTNYQIFPGAPQ